MEKKDEFKSFVRKNPSLVKYVKNGEKTWQSFYEICDLYGEDDSVWNDYLKKEENKGTVNVVKNNTTVGDFFNFLKGIDLNSLQETVSSLQRVLGVFGDLTSKNTETKKEEYKPRPLYKHFDD